MVKRADRYLTAISAPEEKRVMSCEGKERFSSYRTATKIARRVSKRHDEPITPYRCRFCNRYHIGAKNKTDSNRKRIAVATPEEEFELDFLATKERINAQR